MPLINYFEKIVYTVYATKFRIFFDWYSPYLYNMRYVFDHEKNGNIKLLTGPKEAHNFRMIVYTGLKSFNILNNVKYKLPKINKYV